MTITSTTDHQRFIVFDGVYAPQHDSALLIAALEELELAGRHVADLCTGSGVIAIAADHVGASSVTGFDICPRAVARATTNAATADVAVDVRLGAISTARARGSYDVVTANPQYVPTPESRRGEVTADAGGPAWAFNAGQDGRLVLDGLCTTAAALLTDAGTMLIVQSEFAGIDDTLAALRADGLTANVAAQQRIPFGPVLTARASWLRNTGRLAPGQRHEKLAVIRADKHRP